MFSNKRLYFEVGILILLTAVLFGQKWAGHRLGREAVGPRTAVSAAEGKGDVSDFERLLPLHQVKTSPGPYDWLARHDEPGQTFSEYTASSPVRPEENRDIIYIVLLGEFSPLQKEIVQKTAGMIRAYYGLETRFLDDIPLSVIPQEARRVHPQTGDRQILSTYVIEDILKGRMPEDGYCLIAFTSSDLWPGAGWNFVFGQASLEDRLGVWSIYRNGNPAQGREAYDLCLRRTAATGLHEIGHMFGMYHCIYFECLMNGSNHRKESDSRPLWLCPVCLRKLLWITGEDMRKRFRDLERVFEENNMKRESGLYQKSLKALR